MDLIFILCFAYAVYRASLDAAVNGYAVAKGRPVTVGGRDYSGTGRTFGTVLAVLWQSLVEGWRSGRPWARKQAAEFRARRAAKRRATPEPDWDAELDGPNDMVRGAGWTDDEWAAFVRKHGGSSARAGRDDWADEDGDDGAWSCARCGVELDEDMAVTFVRGEGPVCARHLDTHCASCGHEPRPGDPLVLDGGYWRHRSHTTAGDADCPVPDEPLPVQPAPPVCPVPDEPPGPPPAVVDLDAAEWTRTDPTPAAAPPRLAVVPPPASRWAKARTHRPGDGAS